MQVAQLRGIAEDLERHGVSVVLVGSGTPAQALAYQRGDDVPFPLYVDPERRAYRALGMTRRVALGTVVQALRAMRAGYRQQRPQGHAAQSGGVILFDEDGEQRFANNSRYSGDFVAPEDILAALPEHSHGEG